jgi:hypothetical protein
MMPIERVKFQLKPLVDSMLDQLPPHVFTSDTTTFLDPAFGGGQFLREVVTRLRAAGHSDDNIRSRIYGCEITNFRVKYATQLGGVISDNLIKADCLSHDWGDMKFDVILGNPPFSKVGEGKTAGKRSEELYTQFYKWAVNRSDIVAMVLPTTDKKLQKNHNDLLRQTANTIEYIDPSVFPGVTMPMWYVIANRSDQTRPNINWVIDGSVGNDIPWHKGAINMTAHKNLVGEHLGHDAKRRKTDIQIYHKVNVTHGLVQLYCDSHYVSDSALFPNKGWAVLMPQTFNDDGWSKVEVIKCDGQQAAFNGMNIVFVNTKQQAHRLIAYMATPEFISQANQVKQGFNNMNLSCLRAIKLTKSFSEIVNPE